MLAQSAAVWAMLVAGSLGIALLNLGDAGGTTVLYDLESRHTIRVASSRSSCPLRSARHCALGRSARASTDGHLLPTISSQLPEAGWSTSTQTPNFLDLWMKRGAHAREIAFFYFP